MSKKKDLTRIEDLGEYLHQLDDETDEATSFESETSDFTSPEEESTEEENFSTNFESESTDFSSEFSGPENFSSGSDFQTDEEGYTFPEDEASKDSEETLAPPTFESSEESTVNPVEEVSFSAPISEEAIEETPEQSYSPPEPLSETRKEPETFADVKAFAESTHFTETGVEGNPSFSVLLKNVKFAEDVSDILSLLKEFKLISDDEEQTRSRLMRGQLLIPRISEFTAIFIAHKLRRFDLDIQVGLSDDIHPPKHLETPELGVVSKTSLYQNQHHHFQFEDSKLNLSQIIVAGTPSLEGYHVVRYLGVASEHQMLDGDIVEDEVSEQVPKYYHELAQKLKAHALKQKANAVVGLNYQLTPLPSEYGHSIQRYRLSCTGNLVWVRKI
jgi:uncharacterized protein YbjQ (UPF0145 family)